jgi:cyclic pyranopterin phosphate synthase
MSLIDTLDRPLRSLRLSVTDRCNIRCQYCMPEQEYAWLPRESILAFEEVGRLVDVFTGVGVDRLRITGGEPLLRRDLPELVHQLSGRSAIRDLALTTNGILLTGQARDLKAAGLHRLTVSLDTLRAERFRQLTRYDQLGAVFEGIDAALAAGFAPLKIDAVVMRNVNDDELVDLIEYGRRKQAEVRFIEYMDVGGATRWSPQSVVSRGEMLAMLAAHYGPIAPIDEVSSAPADRYRLADGTTFGIISSTTQPFCRLCDRSRLTADGLWYLCLYATRGIDLRALLRSGADDAALRARISAAWRNRDDRGAEKRLAAEGRGAFVPIDTLRREPHLEMHTRGG